MALWFDDLARGNKSLANMAKKKIPNMNEGHEKHSVLKKDLLDYLYQSKVPIPRALWFLKMNQIGGMLLQQPSKLKRPWEHYGPVLSFLKSTIKKLDSTEVFQRWPYFCCLFKHGFEEGIFDRQEFLFDLCDLLTEHLNFPTDKPYTFRILITFISQFIDLITQNVIIARRLGYICCSRLAKYKEEYEKKFGYVFFLSFY